MNPRRGPPFEERLAVACLALLVGITLLNVAARYFTDESIAWTEEISVFLMVVLTLAGASAVARRDGHIRIEFLLVRRDAARTPRRVLWHGAALLCSLAGVALAVLFARWVWDQYRYDETSMGLGVPLWWYGAAMPPLCLALAARAFSAFWRLARGEAPTLGGHEEPP